MDMLNLKCTNCGAHLVLEDKTRSTKCTYCGAQFLVDDGIDRYRLEDPEETGYLIERGRWRAIQEVEEELERKEREKQKRQQEYQARQSQLAEQKRKRKSRRWLWVLGWILIFPVPLTILMLKNKKLNLSLRIAIIAAAWIVYFIIAYLTPTDTPTENTQSTRISSSYLAAEYEGSGEV